MLPCSSSLAVQMSMCAGSQAAGRSQQMRLQQPWQVGDRLQLKLWLPQQCGPCCMPTSRRVVEHLPPRHRCLRLQVQQPWVHIAAIQVGTAAGRLHPALLHGGCMCYRSLTSGSADTGCVLVLQG